MRIAVTSCLKYSDCWGPFFSLFRKFWPDCPVEPILITDGFADKFDGPYFCVEGTWCEMICKFAAESDDDVLMLQDDMWLSAPVNQQLIDRGLDQLHERQAGMVRLYPCPGADEDYGDPHFGIVNRGSRYRVSCQAGLWRSSYLRAIASRFRTPQEFELQGTPVSESMPEEVLAWKRDVLPTPISYEVTAVINGLWSQGAKRLADHEGVSVDWSQRGFQPA